MRRSRCLGAVLILGLLVALLGAMPSVAYASSQVPFSLTLAGQDTLALRNCPSICLTHNGTGTGTELGDFTSWGRIVGTSIKFLSATQLQGTTFETYVFTAANGDRLYVTNFATGILDLTTGQIPITGHWVITGGTGRFRGATGSGTTSGTLQVDKGLTSLSGTATFVGTISSRGASK